MENNDRGSSLVNVVPRGNNVLVRIEFKASILALASGKPEENSNEKVTFIVAGIGPLVKDLTLSESVLMKISEAYDDVQVDGNERSIKKVTEIYRTMNKSELSQLLTDGDTKADIVQYGLFPEFVIKAHL